MHPSLLTGCKYQYVDGKGKCRLLVYDDICVTIAPDRPLALPLIPLTDAPVCNDKHTLVKFLSSMSLYILSARKLGTKHVGVYVNHDDVGTTSSMYIPCRGIKLDKYTETTELPPLLINEKRQSKLRTFRYDKEVLDILKQYSYKQAALNEGKVHKKDFVIDSDVTYDLASIITFASDQVLRDNRIVVKSKDIRNLCIQAVNTLRLSSPMTLMSYGDKVRVFKPNIVKTGLVFTSTEQLKEWSYTKDEQPYTVMTTPIPHIQYPYFLATSLTGGKVVLVQNVRDGLVNRAYTVARTWLTNGYNPGYDADITDDMSVHTIYKVDSNAIAMGDGIELLEYTNNTVAAMLRL